MTETVSQQYIREQVTQQMQPLYEAFDKADAAPAELDWSEPELWAEIYRLRAAIKGPDGFDTWQDAATDERIRRVKAERALAAPSVVEPEPVDDLPSQLDTIIESCSEAAWAMRAAPEPLDPSIFYDPFKELVRMAYAKGYDDATHPPRAPLTEGALMGIYMEFDRHADKTWTPTEYLLRFAAAVDAHGIGTGRVG